MTEKEKELIIRAICGDVDAIDELCPNVDAEQLSMYKTFLNTADLGSKLWFGWIMFLYGKNLDKALKEEHEINKRLADGWNNAISNAIDKLKKKNDDV